MCQGCRSPPYRATGSDPVGCPYRLYSYLATPSDADEHSPKVLSTTYQVRSDPVGYLSGLPVFTLPS